MDGFQPIICFVKPVLRINEVAVGRILLNSMPLFRVSRSDCLRVFPSVHFFCSLQATPTNGMLAVQNMCVFWLKMILFLPWFAGKCWTCWIIWDDFSGTHCYHLKKKKAKNSQTCVDLRHKRIKLLAYVV